jgi:heme-degrading monooxygenase HmoA
MPLVSITRLRVRSWRYFPVFLFQALRSARQAARSEGNQSTRLLQDRHNTFWTQSVWSSEEAMKAFMLAGTHRSVMHSLLEWCDEAALVHWNQEQSGPPSWQESHLRLKQAGRVSKVNHPSPDQQSFSIPAPQPRPASVIRFR